MSVQRRSGRCFDSALSPLTFLLAPLILGSPSSRLSNLPMLPVDILPSSARLSSSFLRSEDARPVPLTVSET